MENGSSSRGNPDIGIVPGADFWRLSLDISAVRFGPCDIELLLTLADADSICSGIVRTQTTGQEESYFLRVILTVVKYK